MSIDQLRAVNSYRLVAEITMPDGQRIAAEITVDRDAIESAFDPLPRDREMPFAVDAQRRAEAMQRLRGLAQQLTAEKLGRALAGHLAPLLEKVVASRDPVNGCNPEQWAVMRA